jgi:A/G-specific adenine glycosylase
LWEFPTLDFNSPPTPEALRAAPESLLSELLVNPPSEANKSKSKGPLDIVKTEQTGSLRHIFSHIHKTYHSMWLLLEGGGSPPKLAHDEIPQKKKKRKMDVEEDEESSSLRLRWTKESDIDSAK